MRRRWAQLALAAALAAGPAHAEDAFPPAGAGRAARLDWVRRHTAMPAKAATSIDENSLLFIAGSTPLPAGRRALVVREEALSPAYLAATGGRSLRAELDVDCGQRAILLKRLDLYSRPNLQGAAVSRLGALPGWRKPSGMLTMGKALQAACGPEPAPPLRQRTLAEAPPASPAPQPPAAPEPRPEPAPIGRAAAGPYALQVAAVDSAQAAQAVLQALQAHHAELASLARATEPVTVGARHYVRALLTGLPDAASAAKLCEQMRAQGAACFPRRYP